MAEKYYSIPDAAQKLGKSVTDVESMIKSGNLRQFTDATGPVVKASDIDAMAIPDTTEGSSLGLTPLEDSTFPTSGPAAPVSPVFDLGTDDFDLTAEDTQLTGKGIDVLGESGSSEFKLADDLMGKTAAPSSAEPSLEKIENDVNLDSFGSGSGLLDLSLQADDTSLGGVLDEIYPGADLPASPELPVASAASASGSGGNAPMGVAAEAEQIFAGTESGVTTTSALAAAYIEAEPDPQSNALGAMMFVPLLVAIYCLIVMAGATVGVVPTIATSIQDMIWYVMGGAAALALVIMGIGMFMGKKA